MTIFFFNIIYYIYFKPLLDEKITSGVYTNSILPVFFPGGIYSKKIPCGVVHTLTQYGGLLDVGKSVMVFRVL